jgi:cytochrome c-type biogenesis protein CcmH
VAGVVVVIPLLAAVVYFTAGEPDAVSVAGASQVLQLDPETQRVEIETWRDALAGRVRNRPEDAQSWYLLGVTRMQLGEFGAAAEAFASAHGQIGADPIVDLYWLQSRYLAAGGEIDDQSRAIAERILEGRPNHPLVLEMLAIEAYRTGEYRSAVEHLNRALNNPLAPSQYSALLSGLEQAREQMGEVAPSVDVQVSAPPEAPRDATLFVIARPPGGGMPYAVIRRPASLLPLAVRLDDTTAMNPALTLSAAGEIQVVVRLSRSGSPTPAPGDWEWQSEVLSVEALAQPMTLTAALTPRSGDS